MCCAELGICDCIYEVANSLQLRYCPFAEGPDLERVFQLPPTTYMGGNETSLQLKEIIKRLEVRFLTQLWETNKHAKDNFLYISNSSLTVT